MSCGRCCAVRMSRKLQSTEGNLASRRKPIGASAAPSALAARARCLLRSTRRQLESTIAAHHPPTTASPSPVFIPSHGRGEEVTHSQTSRLHHHIARSARRGCTDNNVEKGIKSRVFDNVTSSLHFFHSKRVLSLHIT